MSMSFISFDLELNQPSQRIIQVGICTYIDGQYTTYSYYVDPEEPIDPYITRLTGIEDQHILEQGVPLSRIAEVFNDLLTQNRFYSQPITWGSGDLRELKKQLARVVPDAEDIPWHNRTALNLQSVASFHLLCSLPKKAKNISLKTACEYFKVPMSLPHHNAEIDALNTMKVMNYLLSTWPGQNLTEKVDDMTKGRG